MNDFINMRHAHPRACIVHKATSIVHMVLHSLRIEQTEITILEPSMAHNPLHNTCISGMHIVHKSGPKTPYKYAPLIHSFWEETYAICP